MLASILKLIYPHKNLLHISDNTWQYSGRQITEYYFKIIIKLIKVIYNF